MAAGDKSKKLVIDIRDAIGDTDNTYYKNDNQIYQRLNHYQLRFMTRYFTTFKLWEIALEPGVYKYRMDDTILAVIHRPYSSNEYNYYADWINQPYVAVSPENNAKRTFILQNEALIVSGDKLFVETYVKNKELISKSVDPEIGDDYLSLLVEAVKSEHKERMPDRGFDTLQRVERAVKEMADSLKTKKVVKGSRLKNINF